MTADVIYVPGCYADLMNDLKPKWQHWMTVAVMDYITKKKLPYFPTRFSNSARIAWNMMKYIIDHSLEADKKDMKPVERKSVDDKLLSFLELATKAFQSFLDRKDGSATNSEDQKGCKKRKRKVNKLPKQTATPEEAHAVVEEAAYAATDAEQEGLDANGCKKCKQTEIMDAPEEMVYEEEQKKTKKRNSPCTPYRKENKKRKEEVFPLYPPKGEEKKENNDIEEVEVIDEVTNSGEQVEVKIEDGNLQAANQRRMRPSRHRIEMIREQYNALTYGKLRPLEELDKCTYRMVYHIASNFTDQEILDTVTRAAKIDCLNGNNQFGFQADFFYLFKDIVYTRIKNKFYEFGDEKIVRNEEYRIGTAKWWADNAEQMEAEHRRMEAEVAAAIW